MVVIDVLELSFLRRLHLTFESNSNLLYYRRS